MKKHITMIIVFILIITATLNISGHPENGNIYEFKNFTVIFNADSVLSEEEQQHLAEHFAHEHSHTSVQPYNLLCSIFGHKYQMESFTAITHQVQPGPNRCWQEYLTVDVCSRCNDVVLLSSSGRYISCCP